ncbi:hypothetical protein ACMHYS_30065, partial [Rhodococcus erythropolis]
ESCSCTDHHPGRCVLPGSTGFDHSSANPTLRPYGPHPKARHPAELTAAERAAILEVLTSDGYADLSVAQVWARELDCTGSWPRTG